MTLISLIRHLEDNLDEWLTEELDNYLDDDYLVFDCPGIYYLCVHEHMHNSKYLLSSSWNWWIVEKNKSTGGFYSVNMTGPCNLASGSSRIDFYMVVYSLAENADKYTTVDYTQPHPH